MRPQSRIRAISAAAPLFILLAFSSGPAQTVSIPLLHPAVQKPNEMRLDSITTSPGQLVSLTVSLTNERPVGLLYMRMSYDPIFLSLQSVTTAPRNVSWTFFDFDAGAPSGEISITGITDTLLPMQPDSGPVCYIHFQVIDQSVPPNTFLPICFIFQNADDNRMYDSAGVRIDTNEIDYICGGITLNSTGIADEWKNRPGGFELGQNYPNPFNANTSFTLAMPKSGSYSVRIYNLAGQVVKSFEGEALAGKQILTWDGTDQNGASVSSGIYFYKANAAGYSETKKMILIR